MAMTNDKKRILMGILVIGFLCILLVIMTAYAAEIRCENNDLISGNEALQSEVETLQIKIKTESNIEYIEKVLAWFILPRKTVYT